MAAVTELGYVCFGVSDLAAWRDFATNLLGLEVFEEPGEPDRLYLRTDYWHHRIILEKNPADDLTAAGLRVAGVEEFAAMQKALKDAGVKFEVGGKDLAASRRVLEIMRLVGPGRESDRDLPRSAHRHVQAVPAGPAHARPLPDGRSRRRRPHDPAQRRPR